MISCAWKPNWDETREHFAAWWRHDGLVLGAWTAPEGECCREAGSDEPVVPSPEVLYSQPTLRARALHASLARQRFVADTLPVADPHIGPGSLALLLGAEPEFSVDTVWYHPVLHACTDLAAAPSFAFNPGNRWWQITETTIRESLALGKGKYFVGCPDLVEGLDILAALRDPQTLLLDMLEEPEWVIGKVAEIDAVWREVYQRIYDLTKLEDGSSCYGAFRLWGSGKTAKVQCDASAMFSPAMFEQFVVPGLTAQCQWLDHSLFHLDGHQALCHLDALLAIEALDAIEWTPDPTVPSGGSPAWYDLYRRILEAGKSVQAVGVQPHEIKPLLDAVGGRGMYIMTSFASEEDAQALMAMAEQYRG
jgi:hypothetical protein